MRDALRDGVPLAAFKRGGDGLDSIAQQMRSSGDISQDIADPSERLIEMLRRKQSVEIAGGYDDEYGRYLTSQMDEDTETEQDRRRDEEAIPFAEGSAPPKPITQPAPTG